MRVAHRCEHACWGATRTQTELQREMDCAAEERKPAGASAAGAAPSWVSRFGFGAMAVCGGRTRRELREAGEGALSRRGSLSRQMRLLPSDARGP